MQVIKSPPNSVKMKPNSFPQQLDLWTNSVLIEIAIKKKKKNQEHMNWCCLSQLKFTPLVATYFQFQVGCLTSWGHFIDCMLFSKTYQQPLQLFKLSSLWILLEGRNNSYPFTCHQAPIIEFSKALWTTKMQDCQFSVVLKTQG